MSREGGRLAAAMKRRDQASSKFTACSAAIGFTAEADRLCGTISIATVQLSMVVGEQ